MARQKIPAYITEKKPFPERLRFLMEITGTTQVRLAQTLGMTRQGVSLYSNGQTVPDVETFAKIADFFNVSLDYLLGRSGARKNKFHGAVETTGLSESVIEKLSAWEECFEVKGADGVKVGYVKNTKAPREIDDLLKNKRLPLLVAYMRALNFVEGRKLETKNMVLGPAKVDSLKKEIGINETRDYILFLVINTFKDMIGDIFPFTPKIEERAATKSDLDDLF